MAAAGDRRVSRGPTDDGDRRRRALAVAAHACAACRNCPLFAKATQAVWGEGPADAALMLVGEQPGDVEDQDGRPFVGPAGLLLRALIDEACPGTPVYITNAVKHFKFVERGKRRLHQKPDKAEIVACRPWVMQEIDLVRPRLVVALGATAAFCLFGPKAAVTRDRGRPLALDGTPLAAFDVAGLVTFHPSAALRAPTPDRRRELRDILRADLATAARLAEGGASLSTGPSSLRLPQGRAKAAR